MVIISILYQLDSERSLRIHSGPGEPARWGNGVNWRIQIRHLILRDCSCCLRFARWRNSNLTPSVSLRRRLNPWQPAPADLQFGATSAPQAPGGGVRHRRLQGHAQPCRGALARRAEPRPRPNARARVEPPLRQARGRTSTAGPKPRLAPAAARPGPLGLRQPRRRVLQTQPARALVPLVAAPAVPANTGRRRNRWWPRKCVK